MATTEPKRRLRFSADDPRTLLCPRCDFEHTHINSVTVQSAGGMTRSLAASDEDGHARVTDAEIELTGVEVGRRHVISLNLLCEGCGEVTAVTFQQHKGSTLVETVHQPPLRPEG